MDTPDVYSTKAKTPTSRVHHPAIGVGEVQFSQDPNKTLKNPGLNFGGGLKSCFGGPTSSFNSNRRTPCQAQASISLFEAVAGDASLSWFAQTTSKKDSDVLACFTSSADQKGKKKAKHASQGQGAANYDRLLQFLTFPDEKLKALSTTPSDSASFGLSTPRKTDSAPEKWSLMPFTPEVIHNISSARILKPRIRSSAAGKRTASVYSSDEDGSINKEGDEHSESSEKKKQRPGEPLANDNGESPCYVVLVEGESMLKADKAEISAIFTHAAATMPLYAKYRYSDDAEHVANESCRSAKGSYCSFRRSSHCW
jgi:hypothetical protein